jgi:putative ABC transport system permease protein
MLKNYLKIGWRNLLKNKTFSLINIIGLAIGLSCFILISLFVLDELSFDRFNANADRIYRVNSDLIFNGSELRLPVASDMMGSTLKKDYPQVEEFTRVFTSNGSKLIRKGNLFINEARVAHVDSTFFRIFSFSSVNGNTETALNEPNTVVITESTAKKYFGNGDPVGKTIETNDAGKTLYHVTAVIRDMPSNSHFHFDFLFSMKNVDYNWGTYTSHNFFTYLVLKAGVDYKEFEKKFPDYVDRYVIPQASQFMQIKSRAEFEKAGNRLSYSLVPLTKIHLYSTDRNFELSPPGNIQYIYIFSAVAIFILIIACINFMNLTTAKSANRAKEVGIRKVLGTERKGLIFQFLSESILMVCFALVFALLIAMLVLPFFNTIASKSMHISNLFSTWLLPALVLLPFLVGLLAGLYPAFFLSRFRPVEVLKGNLSQGSRRAGLRSLLVVFQFTTSIILIIGTFIIYGQLHFIQTTNLGFNKDQVLIVDGANALGNKIEAFKNEILSNPGVRSGTISSYLPVPSSRTDYTFSKTPVMDSKTGLDLQVWNIDYDYLKTMGMELSKGRNFSKDFADSNAIIINETTAKIIGYDEPVGKTLYSMDQPGVPPAVLHIIGVVKNFHFESLRENIGPLCFHLGNSTGFVAFKITAASIPDVLKKAESSWKSLAPNMPYSYQFMDESFSEMYRSEQRVGTVVMIFSVLAILVACLGLFGLAAFVAEQRTKEIGIRKVLGASVQGIVQLLSRDFVRLVLISFLIAVPTAWYFMSKWLQDFAYRIQISWSVFFIAGLLALGIALMTISLQAVKAAVANPVRSLRAE